MLQLLKYHTLSKNISVFVISLSSILYYLSSIFISPLPLHHLWFAAVTSLLHNRVIAPFILCSLCPSQLLLLCYVFPVNSSSRYIAQSYRSYFLFNAITTSLLSFDCFFTIVSSLLYRFLDFIPSLTCHSFIAFWNAPVFIHIITPEFWFFVPLLQRYRTFLQSRSQVFAAFTCTSDHAQNLHLSLLVHNNTNNVFFLPFIQHM